uniref:Ribosome production factor 2 homolog (Trinotate prediction) n=1 Tax=Myxobolus squamalis TaxID=59785 RepID=A0A6B2G2M7_MYXSQ
MRGYRSVSFESGTQESAKFNCIGPNVDLEVRRIQAPELRTFQHACKKTRKIHEPKRIKNVNFDDIGAKMGTVHMEKQDFKKLKTSRPKALKRKFMSQDRERKNLL